MLKYCSIGSGSSGNCHVITYKDTGILIDAGLTGKAITTGIKQADFDIDKIRGIFITHEHSDHIKGAGIMSRKLNIPIYANLRTWCGMKDKIGNVKGENMVVFENDKTYSLGDIKIRPFSIPHDSEDAVGYNIYSDNQKMSILNYLKYRYIDIPDDIFTYKEVIWRILKNIENRPTCSCESCKNNVKFIGKLSWDLSGRTINGYNKYCSDKCANNDINK